jgi:opacity protein-like surface antigen
MVLAKKSRAATEHQEMKMRKSIALAAAATLLASGAATAQTVQVPDRGFYIGGDLSKSSGPGNGDIDGSFANQGIQGTSSNVDNDNIGWGLQLGYRFHRNWAAEVGYREFGDFDYTTSTPGGGSINGSYKVNAFSISGLYLFPISGSNFSLYGKLGLTRTDVNRDVNSQSAGLTATGSDASRTGWLVGLGANYDFARNFFGRVGWDHYDRVGDSSTGRSDVDAFTLGVGFRF